MPITRHATTIAAGKQDDVSFQILTADEEELQIDCDVLATYLQCTLDTLEDTLFNRLPLPVMLVKQNDVVINVEDPLDNAQQ